jgi:hypothetical protein
MSDVVHDHGGMRSLIIKLLAQSSLTKSEDRKSYGRDSKASQRVITRSMSYGGEFWMGEQ